MRCIICNEVLAPVGEEICRSCAYDASAVKPQLKTVKRKPNRVPPHLIKAQKQRLIFAARRLKAVQDLVEYKQGRGEDVSVELTTHLMRAHDRMYLAVTNLGPSTIAKIIERDMKRPKKRRSVKREEDALSKLSRYESKQLEFYRKTVNPYDLSSGKKGAKAIKRTTR